MDGRIWDAFQVAETMAGPAEQFHRLRSRDDVTVGVLRIPSGGMDLQGAHAQDEVYAVIGGRGILRLGDVDHPVAPGAIVYVPAGVWHRFHGNKEQLVLACVLVPSGRMA